MRERVLILGTGKVLIGTLAGSENPNHQRTELMLGLAPTPVQISSDKIVVISMHSRAKSADTGGLKVFLRDPLH